MRTEDLIVSLAQSAAPVRVLRPVPVRLVQWLGPALAIAAIVALAVGPRADLSAAFGRPRYLLLVAAVFGTAVLSATAAFILSVPGSERSPAQRLAPLTIGALWAALLVVWLREGAHAWQRVAALPIHVLCVLVIAALAGVLGTILTRMLARGASLHPGWTSTLAWCAAAAVGALVAHVTCPIDDPAHHLVGHFAPFALVACAGAFLTQRSLHRWRLQT